MLMCLVLLWLMGFLASKCAPQLSINRVVGVLMSCLRSFMRWQSHTASLAALADATYLALVEDCDMLDYNLELQEMGPPANMKTAPETE